jgi:hypothetical protein
MSNMSPESSRSRFRLTTLVGAALLLCSAAFWPFTRGGSIPRDLINRIFTPYVGCRCADCEAHFLLIPTPRGFRSGQTAELFGLAFGLAGAVTIGFAFTRSTLEARIRRRALEQALLCPSCGYPKAGLSENTCPECGGPLSA